MFHCIFVKDPSAGDAEETVMQKSDAIGAKVFVARMAADCSLPT